MRALGVLLGAGRRLQPRLLGAAMLEIVVAAGVEIELAVAQMQNGVDRIVEKLAVVADDERGLGIFLQSRFEPQRAFEIEVIGRLVEQEQIGLGEQCGSQRHAHAPAAGEFRHRPLEIVVGESESAQDFGGARRRSVGVDRIQVLVNLGQVLGLGGFQLGVQRLALRIGGENRVEQCDRRRRMLLIDRSDPGSLRQQDIALQRGEITDDDLEQGRFADPVAPDKTDLGAGRNHDARPVEKPAAPGVENQIVDLQHFWGAGDDRGCERSRFLMRADAYGQP